MVIRNGGYLYELASGSKEVGKVDTVPDSMNAIAGKGSEIRERTQYPHHARRPFMWLTVPIVLTNHLIIILVRIHLLKELEPRTIYCWSSNLEHD